MSRCFQSTPRNPALSLAPSGLIIRKRTSPRPIWRPASLPQPDAEPLGPGPEGQQPPPPSGTSLLIGSTAAYALMTTAAIYLGERTGTADVLAQFQQSWQLSTALLWTAAMIPYPIISTKLADRMASFGEIRSLFKDKFIPTLETLPIWGLALLALGAGVGEEAFFRGFMQTAAIAGLEDWGGAGLPSQAATWLGLAAVSTLFGVLHAITPLYFYFATVAGALFGIEFLVVSLPAAATTHALYDFFALMYTIQEWGQPAWGRSRNDAGGGKS